VTKKTKLPRVVDLKNNKDYSFTNFTRKKRQPDLSNCITKREVVSIKILKRGRFDEFCSKYKIKQIKHGIEIYIDKDALYTAIKQARKDGYIQ
jgi:hypothetical protein